MTPDPETAAWHMAPRQMVTLIAGGDHFPEFGNIMTWFQQHHANVKLDPIQALTPGELNQILASRLNAAQRYGWEEKKSL